MRIDIWDLLLLLLAAFLLGLLLRPADKPKGKIGFAAIKALRDGAPAEA